jgi:hypothetical protein
MLEDLYLAERNGLITEEQRIRLEETPIPETPIERALKPPEDLRIADIALGLIDHQALCKLDAMLYDLDPTGTTEIMRNIVKMCEAKTQRLPIIAGNEAIQKQLLQVYVPYYKTHPFSLNMFSVRVSALSMTSLVGKALTYYIEGAVPAIVMKIEPEAPPCEYRRNETKFTSSGKPLTELIPEKFSLGVTESFTGDEDVGIPRDRNEHSQFFMGIRYAYTMPYWIRRFIAIHMGMPENSKYALYFGIGGLPTRRSTDRWNFSKYPEVKYLKYSRDEKIMKMIMKYQARRGAFYKRYGQYYKRRRV